MGGDATPPEENADLPGLTPERAHLLLQGVCGDFPYHNDGSHLDGGIADDAAWQHCWRRLAAQSAIWYAIPYGAVGRRFTAILAAEWQGVISRSWKSERPLVFAHVVLTKTLGVRRAREIWARIIRRMDLWERVHHAGLVGDAKAEGAAREGRAAFSGEEEDDTVARGLHDTVLPGKLRQAVRWATDREGGECLLLDDQCTKTGRLVAEILREKHQDMRVPHVENTACTDFEEYGDVPETVPLNFTEDDITWIASKLTDAAGALGAQAMELHN